MNIWWYVLIGIFVVINVVDNDSRLAVLQNLMIVLLSTLVSLFLVRFTNSQYGLNAITHDKVKYFLLVSLSFLIMVAPFVVILIKIKTKFSRKTSYLPPSQENNNSYWNFIFFSSWFSLRLIGELIPSLKSNWLYVMFILLSMIAWLITLIRSSNISKKKQ